MLAGTTTANTPGFADGSPIHPAIGTVFPFTQSALTFTGTGIAADTVTNSGGATATVQVLNVPNGNGGTTATVELKIPSLDIDQNVNADATDTTIAAGTQAGKNLVLDADSLNYVLFGSWSLSASASATSPLSAGAFITGYQTPVSQMPTGSATYSATGNNGYVKGTAVVPSGNTFTPAELQGNASLAVNFGTGAITGSLTGMLAKPDGGVDAPWNTVNVTGNVASGASTFSGSTSTPAAVSGTFGFGASATGNIDGAFYGPNGQELGAVWSLHEGSGTSGKSAIGVLSATKQ